MRKDTQKSVDNFEFVFNTLFPDGNIPPFKEIQEKANAGTLSYREAMIAKLYSNGSNPIPALTNPETSAFKAVQKSSPAVLEKAEKFYSVFGVPKSPQLMSGIRSDITKFSNKFKNALDTSFTEIQQAVASGSKGLKPLQGDVSVFDKVFANVKAGKSVEGMQIGGSRIFNSIPDEQALKELLSGIKKIPDDELRQATYLALIGYRGTALQGMSASLEAATEGEDVFPYFDAETEQIVKPDVKKPGKKPLPPTSKPGPVAVDILKFRMANASEFGELFPNVTRDMIASALNEHVYPSLSESTVSKLGRRPSGYTDMRRFFASAVANLLGDVKQASVLIGHTAGAESLEGEIDKVLTNHYARLTKATASAQDVRHKTLFAYESILARLLGKNTSNDLAQFLNLPFQEGVTATYATNDADLLTGDATTSVSAEKQPETPEAAAARNQKNIALDEEITAQARLSAAETQQQVQIQTAETAKGADQYVQDVKTIAAAEAQADAVKAGAKKEQAAQAASDEAEDLKKGLMNKYARPMTKAGAKVLKVVAPPIGVAASMIAAKDTSAAVIEQATKLGLPTPVAKTAGYIAGATEFLPVTPSDIVSVAKAIPTEPTMVTQAQQRQQAAQYDFGDEFGNIPPDTGQPIPTAPLNIPDPVPSNMGMLSAGAAKERVNLATRAAEQGEETTLTGSFLQPQ